MRVPWLGAGKRHYGTREQAGRGDKLAVRPSLVQEFYIHWLISAVGNYSAVAFTLPVSRAYIKHLRRYDEPCNALTTAEPS